jgi:hypothetical protein
MMPDFATMVGGRPPEVADEAVAAGVSFHHQTDKVFHDCAGFVALQRDALSSLLERGVRRGSARAVAHIGVEMLLDESLSRDESGRAAYVQALERGASLEPGTVVWRAPLLALRYADLLEALRGNARLPRPRPATEIAWRLERALASRPRLALDADALGRVRTWAEAAAPQVQARVPDIVSQLCDALDLSPPPSSMFAP